MLHFDSGDTGLESFLSAVFSKLALGIVYLLDRVLKEDGRFVTWWALVPVSSRSKKIFIVCSNK